MTETLRNFGTVGPFTLVLSRTPTATGPGGTALAALALTLVNGSDAPRPVAAFGEGTMATAVAAGEAIIAAVAAAGGSVTLGGDPVPPTPAAGTVGPHTYTRVADLVPGTPLPPGRGVIVKGTGTVGLKLQGGGTLKVVDGTSGQSQQFDGLAVVDADMTTAGPNDSVQILY
ncbi:hypothetical protein MBRA_02489 [Methylobacterium brachiatum]|nr:hypothetical protein MBRA_02489 [Methylobacterium brachiatum]